MAQKRGLTPYTVTRGNEKQKARSKSADGKQAGQSPNLEHKHFFLKRTLFIIAICVGFFVINALAGGYLGFDWVGAVKDIPSGFVWMVTNFVPSIESFEKIEQILKALGKTVLISVAASCVAAVLAYIFAVLGSRSVGIGAPIQLMVRGVATLFRNIPVVAWAFVLLFSFKQSEFTGFLALFLGSFGYLTRCYLENIDEVSGGAVEALQSTGAGYFQVIMKAVVPLSVTGVISWVMYMIETNIRDATLVGILTGTGIGFVFDIYYKSFRYDVAGLIIITIVLAVVVCEAISNYVRRRII